MSYSNVIELSTKKVITRLKAAQSLGRVRQAITMSALVLASTTMFGCTATYHVADQDEKPDTKGTETRVCFGVDVDCDIEIECETGVITDLRIKDRYWFGVVKLISLSLLKPISYTYQCHTGSGERTTDLRDILGQ